MTGRRRAYANDHSLNTAPLTITPPARDRRVGVEALISAPIVFAVEFVSLFFARALLRVVLECDIVQRATGGDLRCQLRRLNQQLSRDVVPASNTARFLIFSGVIALFASAVIIATQGQLGRAKQAIETRPGLSDPDA